MPSRSPAFVWCVAQLLSGALASQSRWACLSPASTALDVPLLLCGGVRGVGTRVRGVCWGWAHCWVLRKRTVDDTTPLRLRGVGCHRFVPRLKDPGIRASGIRWAAVMWPRRTGAGRMPPVSCCRVCSLGLGPGAGAIAGGRGASRGVWREGLRGPAHGGGVDGCFFWTGLIVSHTA